jgi:hypothetical protein
MGFQTNCGSHSDQGSGSDWEQVTVKEATKGVITTVEETSGGQFTILHERVVQSRDSSRVVVKHLDGRVDTLTMAQAKGLVQPQDTIIRTNTVTTNRGGGLGHIIWWGAMGYMIGRNFGSPVPNYIYRDDDRRQRTSGFTTGTGFMSGTRAAEELNRTSTTRTEMRPVSGRSGFFSRFSRSGRG